jgi:WD40 repeat protein
MALWDGPLEMHEESSLKPSDAADSHLVITVHGIRTFGQWQERLEHLLSALPSGQQLEFVHYKYGYLSIVGFMMPFFVRWLIVRQFRKALIAASAKRDWKRIDLVAHSFGTYIISHAIRTLPKENPLKLHTVILSGSVLHSSFPWSSIIGHRVHRVINDCGTRDFILLLAQLFILRMGAAGWTGFVGATGRSFRNRYSTFGHSGYFVNQQGRPDNAYMKDKWVPLLLADDPIIVFDDRVPSLGHGILQFVGNNADPIKLALYIAPFAALSAIGLSLYFSALASETLLIARVAAARNANGDFDSAVPMLLEVMRDEKLRLLQKNRLRPYSPEATAVLYNSTINYRHAHPLTGVVGSVLHAEFSSDSDHLLTATFNKAHYWSLSPEPAFKEVPLSSYDPVPAIVDARPSPNGKLIAVATVNTVVTLWNPETLSVVFTVETRDAQQLLFSPDSKYLAVASKDGTIFLLDVEKRTTRILPITEELPIHCLAFSYDSRYLAAGGDDGHVDFIDLADPEKVIGLHGSGKQRWLAFSRDNRVIGAASDDGFVTFWNAQTHAKVTSFKPHQASVVEQFDFRSDGRQLMTASSDGFVRFWTLGLQLYHIPEEEERHAGKMLLAQYSTDGRLAMSLSTDGNSRLWNTRTGRLIEDNYRTPPAISGALSQDQQKMVVGGEAGFLSVRSVWPAGLRRIIYAHDKAVDALSFSPDGRRVASASSDATVRVWDVATGEERQQIGSGSLPDDGELLNGVVFSPDGNQVLVSAHDGAALYNAHSGSLIKRFDNQFGALPARFSTDGKFVVIIQHNSIELWAPPYERPTRQWADIRGRVSAVAFTADGKSMAFSNEKELFLWDLANTESKPVGMLSSANILKLGFAGAPTRIVGVGLDSSVSLWDTEKRFAINESKGLSDLVISHLLVLPRRNLAIIPVEDGVLKVVDIAQWKIVADMRGHRRDVTALTATKDERLLFSSSGDGTIRMWDLGSLSPLATITAHGADVNAMHLSPDESLLATAASDGAIYLWQVYASGQSVVDAARAYSPKRSREVLPQISKYTEPSHGAAERQ